MVMGGHREELWGLVTHPSERVFATAGDDKVLRVWDMDSFKPVEGKSIGMPYGVRSMAWRPDESAHLRRSPPPGAGVHMAGAGHLHLRCNCTAHYHNHTIRTAYATA